MEDKDKRIAELEDAIRPFANMGIAMLKANEFDKSAWATAPDTVKVIARYYDFTFGDYRKAARLLYPDAEYKF